AFFFQAEDGIRDRNVTGVQTCALPISMVAMPIPITELRLISFKFSFFVMPASIRRCAPENVMYPPTVPPSRVRIAGKISFIGAEIGRASCRERVEITGVDRAARKRKRR